MAPPPRQHLHISTLSSNLRWGGSIIRTYIYRFHRFGSSFDRCLVNFMRAPPSGLLSLLLLYRELVIARVCFSARARARARTMEFRFGDLGKARRAVPFPVFRDPRSSFSLFAKREKERSETITRTPEIPPLPRTCRAMLSWNALKEFAAGHKKVTESSGRAVFQTRCRDSDFAHRLRALGRQGRRRAKPISERCFLQT